MPSAPARDPDPAPLRNAAGLLALQSLPEVGPRTALKIARAQAPADVADRHLGDPGLAAAMTAAQAQIATHQGAGLTVLDFFDDRYPPRLRQIPNPPPLLYARGELRLLAAAKLLAVVGSREPGAAGAAATEALTTALAASGWAIVSGLATGVDAIAHRSAIDAGAATLAVLAGGLDKVSPPAHRPLAKQILAERGALLSEQPLGTPNLPATLVSRNRLQSGLAAAVVIAASGLRGGTMHTARYAAEQGRPILVPVDGAGLAADPGTRALLQSPARELCDLLPAWHRAQALCERLGPQPLAFPLRPASADADLSAAIRATADRPTQLRLDD